MNKLIKIGLASLMVFTIGCSSKKSDSQAESSNTTQQTENGPKRTEYKTTERANTEQLKLVPSFTLNQRKSQKRKSLNLI